MLLRVHTNRSRYEADTNTPHGNLQWFTQPGWNQGGTCRPGPGARSTPRGREGGVRVQHRMTGAVHCLGTQGHVGTEAPRAWGLCSPVHYSWIRKGAETGRLRSRDPEGTSGSGQGASSMGDQGIACHPLNLGCSPRWRASGKAGPHQATAPMSSREMGPRWN